MTRNDLQSIRAISIHAPRTGSDMRIFVMALRLRNFNPRSPHGERLYQNRMSAE